MTISIREAGEEHTSSLFNMNKQLMEDEQYDRALSDEDLQKRWTSFLSELRYRVLLFLESGDVIGYAVVHMDQEPLYLRHFFIKREYRKKGYGTKSFNTMLEYLDTDTIDLDVMSWNQRGYDFWRSLGFQERCKMMSYRKA
jgi:GNAT superfamily N-acetyltransferase